MQEYLAILIMVLFAAIMAVVILCLNKLIGPKNKDSAVKGEPYECGVEPFELPGNRFSIKFYVAAMLFVAFDVEILFLYLWAVYLRELGWFGFIEVLVFLIILGAGLIYAWRKGVLRWK